MSDEISDPNEKLSGVEHVLDAGASWSSVAADVVGQNWPQLASDLAIAALTHGQSHTHAVVDLKPDSVEQLNHATVDQMDQASDVISSQDGEDSGHSDDEDHYDGGDNHDADDSYD